MSDTDLMKQTPVLSTSVETIASAVLTVPTRGEGFIDITSEVARFLKQAGGRAGAVTLFIRHTSASLTIQENADPDVLADLITSYGEDTVTEYLLTQTVARRLVSMAEVNQE